MKKYYYNSRVLKGYKILRSYKNNPFFGFKFSMLDSKSFDSNNLYDKKSIFISKFNNRYIKKIRTYINYRVVSINKVSHTLKKGKIYNYKIITCNGNKSGWSGIGIYSCGKFFESLSRSKYKCIDNIYITRLNKNNRFESTYKFKFKGCNIEFVNKYRERFKQSCIVNIVQSLLGIYWFNVKSFCSNNTNVLIKLLLNSLTKVC